MFIRCRGSGAVALFAVTLVTPALAQQPGPGARHRPVQSVPERYKYTFQLMQMVRHIGEIDKDRKFRYLSLPRKPGGCLRSSSRSAQDRSSSRIKRNRLLET